VIAVSDSDPSGKPQPRIGVVNAGSSSVKFALFEIGGAGAVGIFSNER